MNNVLGSIDQEKGTIQNAATNTESNAQNILFMTSSVSSAAQEITMNVANLATSSEQMSTNVEMVATIVGEMNCHPVSNCHHQHPQFPFKPSQNTPAKAALSLPLLARKLKTPMR